MKPNFPHRLLPLLACVLGSKETATLLVLLGLAAALRSIGREDGAWLPADGAVAPSSTSHSVTQRGFAPRGGAPGAAKGGASNTEEHRTEDNPEWRAAMAIVDAVQRDEELARLCYERAASDPREALELAIGHGLEKSPGVIANLAQQWADADLPAARAWVEAQAAGAMREELVARIGYVWSLSDPAKAADFVTNETTPGEAQTEAAISVLHRWSEQDPAAARDWVECFPEGSLRERALHEVGGLQAQAE